MTISDIKQARQLLQNLIQSNPKHAPGWIAAASLEGESAAVSFSVRLCANA